MALPPLKFSIFEITATPMIPIADSTGGVKQPESPFVVWSMKDADPFIDGLNGSTMPVGFLIPTTPANTYSLHLGIVGACTFPVNWPRGPLTCQLKGTLQDDSKSPTVIESETWQIDLPASDIELQKARQFELKSFTISAPFVKLDRPVPFRVAGDFQWEIVSTTNQEAQPLKSKKATRLEFNWLLGPAISEANETSTPDTQIVTDLGGVYPINLLRLFLPCPADFVAAQDSDKVCLQWWMRNCLKKIQAPGLIYDTIVGKSGFGVGCCGGSFKFDEFYKAVSPASSASAPRHVLINSFDLASLAQLACDLLVQVKSQWVCKSPFGVQKAGLPFGLTEKTVHAVPWPPGVNNPYFTGIDAAIPYESDVAKVKTANARSWIEASFSENEVSVIDWAFAVPDSDGDNPEFENAFVGRQAFARRHIVEDKPSDATYFSNDEIGPRQLGSQKDVARVGLYNLRGLNEPGDPHVPHTYLPPRLRSEIKALISSGKNPKPQRWLYNDTSLKALNIAPVVTKGSHLQYECPKPKDHFFTALRVVSGATSASYNFSGLPMQNGETGSIALTISVFDDFPSAYEAMAFTLSTYERKLTEIAKPPKGPTGDCFVGHYSLQTPRSLAWVRGNLFVELTIQCLSKPSDTTGITIVAAGQRLDAHLARHAVVRSQVRRPHLDFTTGNTPPEHTVDGNTPFQVQFRADDLVLAHEMGVSIDRPSLLVHGGFNADESKHEFWVMRRSGTEKGLDRKATVRIAGAHIDTFHPEHVKFEVTVAGEE